MRRPFSFLTIIVLGFTLAISACNPTLVSDTKIDSGRHITPKDEDTVPGVAWIGGCTATIVSDSTLITAAHCIGDQQICATNKVLKNVCTNQVFVHPKFSNGSLANDVAVAIFKPGSFKYYFNVKSDDVKKNDPIFLVGYSKENCTPEKCSEENGSKRWGRNKVGDLENAVIESFYGKNADSAVVSRGDSGGPQFSNQCSIQGVTSFMSNFPGAEDYNPNKPKMAGHTNLTVAPVLSWIRGLEQKGAYYCGLTGNDPQRCNSEGLAVRIADGLPSATGEERFPCSPAEQAGYGELTGHLFARLDPKSADSGMPKMNLAVPRDAETVTICENSSDFQACLADTANQTSFPATGIEYKGRKMLEGYQFKTQLDSSRPAAVIVKRKNGEITAARVLRFESVQ